MIIHCKFQFYFVTRKIMFFYQPKRAIILMQRVKEIPTKKLVNYTVQRTTHKTENHNKTNGFTTPTPASY